MISFDLNLITTILIFILFVSFNINTNNKYLKKLLGRKNKKYIIFIYILFPIILYTILNNFNSTERFTLSSQSVAPGNATDSYMDEIQNLAEYMNFGRPKCQTKIEDKCQAIDPENSDHVTACGAIVDLSQCNGHNGGNVCQVVEDEPKDQNRFCIRLNNKINRLRSILILYVIKKEEEINDASVNVGEFIFSADDTMGTGQEVIIDPNSVVPRAIQLIRDIQNVVRSDTLTVNVNGVSNGKVVLNTENGDMISEDEQNNSTEDDDDFLFLRFQGDTLADLNNLYRPSRSITINQIINGEAYEGDVASGTEKKFFNDICLASDVCDYIGPNVAVSKNDNNVMGVHSGNVTFREIKYGLNHCDIANFAPYDPNGMAPREAALNNSYSDAYTRWETYKTNNGDLLIGTGDKQRPWLVKSAIGSKNYMDIANNPNRLGMADNDETAEAERNRLIQKCNQFPTCDIIDDSADGTNPICEYTADFRSFNLSRANITETTTGLPFGIAHREYGRGFYDGGFRCDALDPANDTECSGIMQRTDFCLKADGATDMTDASCTDRISTSADVTTNQTNCLTDDQCVFTQTETATDELLARGKNRTCVSDERCRVRSLTNLDELLFEESSKVLPYRHFGDYIQCVGGTGTTCTDADLQDCKTTTDSDGVPCELQITYPGLCRGNPDDRGADGTTPCSQVVPTIDDATGNIICGGSCEPIGLRDIILPGSESTSTGTGANAGTGTGDNTGAGTGTGTGTGAGAGTGTGGNR